MRSSAATLRLEYRLDDSAIHHFRLMVHSFVVLSTKDRTAAGRITVTCAELVEDAGRRNPASPCLLELEIDPRGSASAQLTCDITDAQYAQLAQVVREVNVGSPVDAYTRALAEAAHGAVSALSLSRVRYEGAMSLSLRQAGPRATLIAASTR